MKLKFWREFKQQLAKFLNSKKIPNTTLLIYKKTYQANEILAFAQEIGKIKTIRVEMGQTVQVLITGIDTKTKPDLTWVTGVCKEPNHKSWKVKIMLSSNGGGKVFFYDP